MVVPISNVAIVVAASDMYASLDSAKDVAER